MKQPSSNMIILSKRYLPNCRSDKFLKCWKPRVDIHIFMHCFQIQLAETVLVVGGGSTGVEMAAEVKTEYPDKKVISRPV